MGAGLLTSCLASSTLGEHLYVARMALDLAVRPAQSSGFSPLPW
jgi:hypothetical protein